MKKNFSGGCSCGSVRYTLLADPMFTHCCHCHLCQQITGSAFITNTLIEGSNFSLNSGQLAPFEGPSGSGSRHIIKRCSKCGDPVVSYFGDTEHLALVKAGTLDNPNLVSPQAHIFVGTKLDWLELPEATPVFTGFYDFEKIWPVGAFARLQKIRALQSS